MEQKRSEDLTQEFIELLPTLSEERKDELYNLLFMLAHCPRFAEVFAVFVRDGKPAPRWEDTMALVKEWMAKEYPDGAA